MLKPKKDHRAYRFTGWGQYQEENRLAWLAGIIFWPPVIAAMSMSPVTDLAASPTRITIPVFFLSLLINLVVITNCITTLDML